MKKLLLSAALLSAAFGYSQQVIGEFPIMDGGLETQTTGNLASIGSNADGTASTTWGISTTGGTTDEEIIESAALSRTGMKSVRAQLNADRSNARIQTVSTVEPQKLLVNTEYTIQFFYSASAAFNDPSHLRPGLYLDNDNQGDLATRVDVTPFAVNTYTKCYGTVTTSGVTQASNWAVARLGGDEINANPLVYIDDFVVYAGAYDDVAPSSPTSATGEYTVSTTADLSWTAAAGGVDGGGYVVVKYSGAAAADTDINQNGIYSVGSTTAAGGTVVYIGTGTSFSDTFTTGSEYKVFTADKAFNYSAGLTLVEEVLSSNDFSIDGEAVSAYQAANGDLTIGGVEVDAASVYALSGAKVATGGQTVDVSALAAGVYIVQVEANGKSTAETIVIK